MRAEVIKGLQERAARAQPAELVEHRGGWWLRHAPRCSWWVGTVLPHAHAEGGELVDRVAGAEEFYAGQGAVAGFQVSPGVCPAGLDGLLAERRYRRVCPISLQVGSAATVLGQARAGSLQVQLSDQPTRAWLEVWHTAYDGEDDSRGEWDMLGRVAGQCAYACAVDGGNAVAVCRAVADQGWTGVFSMATLPLARGKGAATAVLKALAEWADGHGADRMYLQVEPGNAAAVRLYGQAGFAEVCAYHYRTAP
ncbi:MAG TPA: GNAT family N-acetyltransferase [Streptosporangiaceae bacterium]|nr:GNAT family N-acetyltransferase [Streptosporangiaceae bacterium]